MRKSEDFGGDNHIYMYYDSLDLFTLLIRVEDITPYLKEEKLIFLFGKEDLKQNYPLDFKKLYGIDYENMKPQPIRIDEIKRMVLNYSMGACTGNFFLSGVLDFHKDLLKIKDFGLSAFAYLYIACLKGRTVAESVEEINKQVRENYILRTEIFYLFPFRQGGNPPEDANRFFAALNSLFDANYRPTKMEWFKACFLAYSMAEGRQFNGRIAPMIDNM